MVLEKEDIVDIFAIANISADYKVKLNLDRHTTNENYDYEFEDDFYENRKTIIFE